jgi:hypothetical protein
MILKEIGKVDILKDLKNSITNPCRMADTDIYDLKNFKLQPYITNAAELSGIHRCFRG